MNKKIRLWFCDFEHPETESDIRQNMVFSILSNRFDIALDPDNPDILFFSNSGFRHSRYNCLRIFHTGENQIPDYTACDFSLSHEPNSERNCFFPFFALFDLLPLLIPDIPAAKTSFCNFIYSNPYCEHRNRFFHFLSEYKKVDSSGRAFNNMPPPAPRYREDWRTAKIPFMSRYKFTIAFENMSYPGYITEKIIDAFEARTVPIYWGCPNIAKIFNPDAFINCHDFPDFESVVRHVIKVDSDDSIYNSYLSAPPFLGNKIPAAARWDRALSFLENIFDNPPANLASQSRWGKFLRVAPHFIARKSYKFRSRRFHFPMKQLRLRQNQSQTINFWQSSGKADQHLSSL